jgi:hypothetical protein
MWSSEELDKLIAMRALSMSYPECGSALNRSSNSCGSAVYTNNLYDTINKLRKRMIKEAIK